MRGRTSINSAKSARVVQLRLLHTRKHRDERGAFVVEGPATVLAAIELGRLSELWVTADAETAFGEIVSRAVDSGTNLVCMSDSVSMAISSTQQPVGLVGVARQSTTTLSEVLATAPRRVVVLDQVNDPGNAGTIIRTADAAGVDAVIFTTGSVDPYNDKCVRATTGSIFHLPIVRGVEVDSVLRACTESGLVTLATSSTGAQSLTSPQVSRALAGRVVWLFGNEAGGLDDAVIQQADLAVSIPMRAGVESLNIAMAAGICMYIDRLGDRSI